MQSSKRLASIAVLVLVVVAGCSAAKPAHRPKAAHPIATLSAAQVAIQTAEDMCGQLTVTYNAIETAIQNVGTSLAPFLVSGADGRAWNRSLSAAARLANRPGVPAGNNQARRMAVDIDRVAVDLDMTGLAVDMGKSGMAGRSWRRTIRDLNAAQAQCP